ncbi:MAG: phosphatidylserine decarboxylase [Gammaproteobacteria bacterium]|nr:phosphatidylserine decarboxylase [Gammaproteobacteria bacterium]
MCIGVAPPKLKTYPHPIIAREGWPFLAVAAAVSLAATFLAGWLWALPLWVISLFVLQFFRDPPRQAPERPNQVIAPADGRVIAVERTQDPYLNREAQKVSIFMNVFNVHSNRSPVDGVVEEIWYTPGKFINADFDKASTENERNALWIRTEGGWDVTCVQVAGLIARRILCYTKPGDWLERGQRYGFIRFGSRLDVYLPLPAQIRVAIGDKVRAGETVLAECPLNTG